MLKLSEDKPMSDKIDIISHENVNQLYHLFRVAGHSEEGFGVLPTLLALRAALDAQSGVTVKPLVDALKMASIWLNYDGRYDMQGINAALAPFTRKEE